MAKVKFTGQPRPAGVSASWKSDDPDEITISGYTFKLGKLVTCDDEALLAKLRGNSHFDVKEAR